MRIWDGAGDGCGSPAERYLRERRRIFLDEWPPSLRFHPHCPRPLSRENGEFLPPLPAMVGLIEHIERGAIGVHCTYLLPDGSGKVVVEPEPDKAFFGAMKGGAVRFGSPKAGEWFGTAEGIETTLSALLMARMAGWAALSTSGLKNLILPAQADSIIIFADTDENYAGQQAANEAVRRFRAQGRKAAAMPAPEKDFNDLLLRSK
jgi:hypothetical protein